MSEQRLEASTRVALAAYLHDLGKFAERARLPASKDDLEFHKQQYCPRRRLEGGGYHYTHIHAAYTALAFTEIEPHMPVLRGKDFSPFGSDMSPNVVDSLINAAACHHAPDTFLQWIIATADRVASGFEREEFEKYNASDDITDTGKNHYQARQLSLFESIRLAGGETTSLASLQYRQPLVPLSPEGIFPTQREQCEGSDNNTAQQEYRQLWDAFLQSLQAIPASHRKTLPLWLDHFDSAWQTFTHAIPSATVKGTRPEVSLFDHSHTAAALATALWRYHADRQDDQETVRTAMRQRADWNEEKFLLIQGDFFGVQSFIFASGTDTRKKAAKLLRGRSLYVSLITECAALRVLEALDLPATSQVTNAAGKFLIVAPNTEETRQRLEAVQQEFDQWFLSHTYGLSGLGLAWQPASCNAFVNRKGEQGFSQLMKRLFTSLEEKKYQAFDLCRATAPPAVFNEYLDMVAEYGGQCAISGWGPGTEQDPDDGSLRISALAADQIRIGTQIAGRHERLAITQQPLNGAGSLKLPLFGYYLHFTDGEAASGRFGNEVASGNLRRLFDFSLPQHGQAPLWQGYARRAINGYVPVFSEEDLYAIGRYGKHEETSLPKAGALKEFAHLACENRKPGQQEGDWVGIEGLGILKGDVDNLGAIFQQGLASPSFAKMASLSRQMNNFFSVYLPWLCRERYPNTYTVFAGGDDFFLIGPWHDLMALSRELRQAFSRYVAGNPDITFSVGLAVAKPGLPVPQLSRLAEAALEQAKQHTDDNGQGKNAVSCFGHTVSWADFWGLADAAVQLETLREKMRLSTGFVYGLLALTEQSQDTTHPESALWRSHLSYRTWRHLERTEKDTQRRRALFDELITAITANGMQRFGHGYRIAITSHLYLFRA